MENPSEKLLEVNLRCPWWEAVRQPPLLGLRPGVRGLGRLTRETALERLFDAMEEQWEQEALDYWL